MATYFGDSIGDAARSEERALERALNIGLANRQFAAQQQARRDAIMAQNAANSMRADELSRANRQYDLRNRLALEDRDYGRQQDIIDTILGLDEAEKNRQLQRELNTLRNDNYLQRLQQSEDQRTYADIAKRIAADEIRDIPQLQDAEGGRLGSDEWVDLKTRLGQHQQRLREESALGPDLAAREATAMLRADPQYATDPSMAMTTALNRLGNIPALRGKVFPDFAKGEFRALPTYKYSGPEDAIDWYSADGPRKKTAPPGPPQVAPPEPPRSLSLMERLGLLRDSTNPAGYMGRMLRGAFPASAEQPPPPPIQAEADVVPAAPITAPAKTIIDPLGQRMVAEVRALHESGMPMEQAIETVRAKYSGGRPYSTRTF